MIRCPSCGTFNHDSQRVCRSCGSALPQTRRRCPECGALNPVGNLFCDRCNARLIETEDIVPTPAPERPQDNRTAVKGISLPTRASTADEDTGQRAELPDWLAGLVDEDTEFGLTEPAQNGSGEPGPEQDTAEEALPDWLGGGEALTPAPLADAIEVPPLPDWISAGTEDIPHAHDDALGQDEPIPDWLSDILRPDADTEEDIHESPEAEAQFGEEVTRDRLPDESPSEVPEAPIFDESELPDWLADAQGLAVRGVGDADESENELPSGILGVDLQPDRPHDAAPDEGLVLPDWLQEIAAEDSGSDQLPDWLATLSREQPLPQPEATGETLQPTGAETATAPSLTGETPEWLAGLSPAPASARPPIIFEEEPPSEPAEPATAMLPDWLSDLAPIEAPASSKPEVRVFVDQPAAEPAIAAPTSLPEDSDQMPGWLSDLDLEASEAVLPAESVPELIDLAQADLPGWLQELAPPGVLGGGVENPASGVSGTLTPAEIPEWVEALRPATRVEGTPPLARAIPPTPAEPEGPLEGLIGVLPSTPEVDIPGEAKLAAVDRIPETIVTQALLWQKLLEQPRSAERSVWHGRLTARKSSGLFRWAISALLIVGLFAAFWLIPEGFRLARVSPTQTALGVPALVESVERLGPGDTVILAIEYSPAYADEMSQIAAPILAHLSSRQVEALIVSSVPEGVGLGNALSSLPDRAAATGGGYLAGNASGIAAFLAQPEAATADHLVILSSEPQRLIWWLEQNALRGTDALPISIGTSASAGPLVAPYLDIAQVEGWVIGLPQAFAYWEVRGVGDVGDYGRILDLLMIAHWAVAGLLLIAFFYTLFDRKGAS